MSLSGQNRYFSQKCSRSFLKMFGFFQVSFRRLSRRVFQRMAEAGKKDFSRFDDLHRLMTSCKGFQVCRAEVLMKTAAGTRTVAAKALSL